MYMQAIYLTDWRPFPPHPIFFRNIHVFVVFGRIGEDRIEQDCCGIKDGMINAVGK